jgi:hypothetical protein
MNLQIGLCLGVSYRWHKILMPSRLITCGKNHAVTGIIALIISLFLAEPLLADEQSLPEIMRFEINGERVVFNSHVEIGDEYQGIGYIDARELRQILRDHPEITTLELNSDGGGIQAALEMAAVVADFGLNTVVTERCDSACTLVFLGGETRILERGGRLGFHSASWGRDSMIDYYEENRESNGWLDEFAFASWVYEEGMREFNKQLEFMISRGVDVQFIIRAAYVNFSDIWYPTRAELMQFNVILH